MTRCSMIALLTVLAGGLGGALPARAQDSTRGVRIGLTYAPGTKPGVVVAPLGGAFGDSLQAIIQRDLDYGDRVLVVPAFGVVTTTAPGGAGPNYALLAKLGAAALVQLVPGLGGRYTITVHDVGAARVIESRDVTLPLGAPAHLWRYAVHGISDEIEKTISGTLGVAQTQVAFVKAGRVWVTDSDGAVTVAVSDGSALSPSWHPSGRQIAWASLTDAGTRIQVKDIPTGKLRTVNATPGGLNITPTFTPDGASIVYAHGQEDGTDLWIASATDDAPARRLTVGRGSDNTSPTLSPDGRRIAFTSGRSGRPEVYISDVDGTNVELLTDFAFDEQNYRAGPDWSPDGRAIAFATRIDGQFQVATISLRDRVVRVLTSDGKNEDPSWAPDGRHLVFTSNRTGTQELFVVDVESGRIRQLTHERGARLAAWSPRFGAMK